MKIEINKILCTTDLSNFSNHAVDVGISLAEEFGARLYLCHIVDLPATSIHGVTYEYPLEQQKSMIAHAGEKLETLMAYRSVDWEPLITTGPTTETIAGLALEKNVDLLISATHGRSGLKRFLIGSVTERLMKTILCPLLIVNPPSQKTVGAPPRLHFKNILVGCDFSPDSDRALSYGIGLAQEFESDLHLVHVIKSDAYSDVLHSSSSARHILEGLKAPLNQKLSELIPVEVHNWCHVTTVCLTGEPYQELIRYALDHDTDLIVLGIRGRGLVETLLVGSTTDRVARQAPCPVLSVSPVNPAVTS